MFQKVNNNYHERIFAMKSKTHQNFTSHAILFVLQRKTEIKIADDIQRVRVLTKSGKQRDYRDTSNGRTCNCKYRTTPSATMPLPAAGTYT